MCLTKAPDAFPPQPIKTFQITTVQSSSSALYKLRTGYDPPYDLSVTKYDLNQTCPNQVLSNESSQESGPDVDPESWVKSWYNIQDYNQD